MTRTWIPNPRTPNGFPIWPQNRPPTSRRTLGGQIRIVGRGGQGRQTSPTPTLAKAPETGGLYADEKDRSWSGPKHRDQGNMHGYSKVRQHTSRWDPKRHPMLKKPECRYPGIPWLDPSALETLAQLSGQILIRDGSMWQPQ